MDNRKYFPAIICFLCVINGAFAQILYSDLQIKELYDEAYRAHLKYEQSIISKPDEEPGSNTFGVYGSLLDMYELTGDKAYLYRFMEKAIEIIGMKNGDVLWYHSNNHPEMQPYNGRIAMILAHFAFLVYSDPALYATAIYNPAKYNNHATFGSFANWIFQDVDQVLNTATTDPGTWLGECAGVSKPSGGIAELNFQAPWACALLYTYLASLYAQNLGIGTEITDYGVKAIQLARLYFKEDVPYNLSHGAPPLIWDNDYADIEDDYCTMGNYTPNHAVLIDPGDYSYYWWHFGWRPRKQGQDLILEDLGHGQLDILFPLLYNKYADVFEDHLTTGDYFTEEEMIRFRNGFTKHIYNPSNALIFHRSVDGNDNSITDACNGTKEAACQPSAMNWMPFYQFDGANNNAPAPDVYNILMDYVRDDVLPNNTTYNPYHFTDYYFAGLRMKGFAQIAAAQWDKECYSLTLKNRDVVYDQDFYARNRLTIDPAAPNTYDPSNPKPFADPETFTDGGTQNRFVIEPGTTVNFSADGKIVGKPGFHAKAGSQARAYITPSICASGDRMGRPDGNGGKEETKTVTTNDSTAVEETSIAAMKGITSGGTFEPELYPNPNSGVFTLKLPPGMAQQASVEIRNLLGEMIYSNPNTLQVMTEIDLSSQPKGLYYVSVISGGGVFRCAVAVQ